MRHLTIKLCPADAYNECDIWTVVVIGREAAYGYGTVMDIKPYFKTNGKIPLRKAVEKRHLPGGAQTIEFLRSCLSKIEQALEKRRK